MSEDFKFKDFKLKSFVKEVNSVINKSGKVNSFTSKKRLLNYVKSYFYLNQLLMIFYGNSNNSLKQEFKRKVKQLSLGKGFTFEKLDQLFNELVNLIKGFDVKLIDSLGVGESLNKDLIKFFKEYDMDPKDFYKWAKKNIKELPPQFDLLITSLVMSVSKGNIRRSVGQRISDVTNKINDYSKRDLSGLLNEVGVSVQDYNLMNVKEKEKVIKSLISSFLNYQQVDDLIEGLKKDNYSKASSGLSNLAEAPAVISPFLLKAIAGGLTLASFGNAFSGKSFDDKFIKVIALLGGLLVGGGFVFSKGLKLLLKFEDADFFKRNQDNLRVIALSLIKLLFLIEVGYKGLLAREAKKENNSEPEVLKYLKDFDKVIKGLLNF